MSKQSSFAGHPFQQTWRDLPHWEHFLNAYPCRSVLELGTGHGAMSMFFAVQAKARGMSFSTFDRVNLLTHFVLATLDHLDVKRYLVDIFDQPDAVREVIAQLPHPLVLFCDNGDKPREFRTFVPSLTSGDYVAVHDWNSEIRTEDIQPPLPMVLADECEATNSMTRFFRID